MVAMAPEKAPETEIKSSLMLFPVKLGYILDP